MIIVQYQSHWQLNVEEKRRLLSDYGVVDTTAQYDPATNTVVAEPINADNLNFFPSNFIGSFVIYKGKYYPTYLKEHDPNEYVNLEIVLEEEGEQEDESNG